MLDMSSEHLEPARTVIAKIGVDKVAEITGKHVSRVYRWMYPKSRGGTGGLIPQPPESDARHDRRGGRDRGRWLVNKAREVGGKKTAVTNPAKDPVPGGYEAKHRGGGSYSVMLGDEEVVQGLDKEQAEQFNALTDAQKAEQVKGATE